MGKMPRYSSHLVLVPEDEASWAFVELAFMEHVLPSAEPGGCWGWRDTCNSSPWRPYWYFGAAQVYAYRAAYELYVGPIHGGLEVDHVCGFNRCVNPDHLELVSPAENKARQVKFALGRLDALARA